MSRGRKPEGYCLNYHCPGDCGRARGVSHVESPVIDLAQRRHKLATLAAFEALEREAKRAETDAKADVRRKAKDSL